MNVVQSSHQFADAATAQIQGLRSHDCQLIIRQGPENARVAVGKEKDRKPVDPPPIIQLKISPASDPGQNYLQSPYFFMSCSLIGVGEGIPQGTLGAALAGTLVSSLHRLKDSDNNDGAFFVFGDLSVKLEGTFRLQFNLYEMRQMECYHIQAIQSDPFRVHSTKNFQGMAESTFLTRSFSDQGVRLRLRKEPRTLLRKRGPAHDDYQPRHYRTSNRQSSQGAERQSITSPESQEAVRQSQNEQVDFIESPQGLPHSYDQRPPMGRHFSQQSAASYQGISYEESSKRPRRGSEQSQTPTFSQQSLDSQQYPARLYPEPQQSPFSSFAPHLPQAASFPFPYTQSPQGSSTAARDHYFTQKLNVQTVPTSPYDLNPHRSPQFQQFPPQPQAIHFQPSQRQQGQYGGSQMLAPAAPIRIESESAQASFEVLGLSPGRGQTSPLGGASMAQMAPPLYGRIGNNMSYLQTSGRRESYQAYPSPNSNVNLSAVPMGTIYPRPPAVTTSGPGGLDPGY